MKKFMILAAAAALAFAPIAAFAEGADGGDVMPGQEYQVPAPRAPHAQVQQQTRVASGTSHMYFTVQPKPTQHYEPDFGGAGNG